MYVLRVNPDGRGPMYKKTLTSKGEQVWKPTEHCAAKMATVCERLVPWMRKALGTTLPPELVEEYSSQGVWVEKMFY